MRKKNKFFERNFSSTERQEVRMNNARNYWRQKDYKHGNINRFCVDFMNYEIISMDFINDTVHELICAIAWKWLD